MARYRIRYQGTDLEMPPGEFVVGRSSSCSLALDDALVSRRHAAIHNDPDGVWVEDLGSRNGIQVNGERVEGKRKIGHLDRVTVGSHELVLVEISDRPQGATTTCKSCGTAAPENTPFCRKCGQPLQSDRATLAGMTLEIPVMDSSKIAKHEPIRPGNVEESTARALLTSIADKAIAMGRFDEAERVLGRTLQEILVRARSGHLPSAGRLAEGTKYALRLAEGLKRTTWLDWVFDLHEATGRLMSAEDIEKVHDLVRRIRYRDVAPVRRYVETIRARAAELGPSERFLLSRLEGIERMVSA